LKPPIKALREAVAKDLAKRRGASVDPGHIIIMPGGKPNMFFAALMFGTASSRIMYPDPGFPIYCSMIKYCGAKPVPIELKEQNELAFSADEVSAQITPRTSLIILNSPGNPTGSAVPVTEIERLVTGLRRHPSVTRPTVESFTRDAST
jgi:aspartate/methionine/tyrosine aminotransferase